MMDAIELKEEIIEDVAHSYDNSENDPTKLDFKEHIFHSHEDTNGFSNTVGNSASCHFFFPSTEGFNEKITLQDQLDPLALNDDCCVYQSESISIDDELLALETLQPTQLSSFSIVDPQNITEPNICQNKQESLDFVEEKLYTEARKRTFDQESKSEENLDSPTKKIKLKGQPIHNEIRLKRALVCIGPKLPLPLCLKLGGCNNVKNTASLKADQHKMNKDYSFIIKVFTCSKCKMRHTDSALHEAHVATCNVKTSQVCTYKDRNGLYCCEFCMFKFKHESNLISHQDKHTKTKGFTCRVCDMVFASIKLLQNHYYDLHKNHPKLFCCNVCEYSNITVKNIKYHMITHNIDKYLYCYKCRQNYDDVDDFNQHSCKIKDKMCSKRKILPKVTISGIKKNNKNQLSVKFSKLKSKFESEVIKLNDTFYCNGCSYTFSNLNSLVQHKKEHLKIQPNKCYVCEYESFSVVDMGKHIKCHLSNKVKSVRIKCGACHVTCKWQLLRRHAVSHIYDELYCSRCRVNFEDSESLIQHMSSSHKQSSKDKIYSCGKCSFKHSIRRAVRKHMKRHLYRENKIDQASEEAVQAENSICPITKVVIQVENNTCPVNKEIMHVENKKGPISKEPIQIKNKKGPVNKKVNNKLKIKKGSANAVTKQVENKKGLVNKEAIQVVDSALERNKLLNNENLENGKYGCNVTSSVSIGFKCTSCRTCFDNAVDLEKHNKGHCSKNKAIPSKQIEQENPIIVFKCNKCEYKCSSIDSLMDHVKLIHLNKGKPFTCSVCDLKVESLETYFQHLKSHNEIPMYCCQYCKYYTKTKNIFMQHHSKHNLKCCPMCVYSTQSFQALKVHANRQHRPRNAKALFFCTLCPYSCSNNKVLSVHAIKFHPKEYPSLKLPVPNYLQETVTNDEDNKLYVCSICQLKNRHIYDFKRHLTRHFVNGKLKVKTQSNSVKKKSVTLKSTFLTQSTKTLMDKILKRGSSVCRYACSQCHFKSEQESAVASHLLRIHNIEGDLKTNMILKLNAPVFNKKKSNKSKTEKNTKCPHCEAEKFSFNAQKQHKKLGHTAFWGRPFSCPTCDSRFNTKMFLDRHECNTSAKPSISKISNNDRTVIDHKMKNHSQICNKSSKTTKKTTKPSKPSHSQQVSQTQKLKLIEDKEHLSSDDESFSCGECNFVTLDVTELINHMFVHSGIQID